jgi:hypothetical protein
LAAVTIGRSVGAGGANIAADVRTIQDALNDIPSESGGPDAALTVDGIVGPLTLRAIKNFQQTHVSIVDSRIDPDGPTLAAINAELTAGVPVASQGIGAAATTRGRRKPEFLPPDPEIIVAVTALIGKVRDLIRAANFQLLIANPFVTNQKLKIPQEPLQASARRSLELLDRVFSLGKFNNPRPPFENIKRAFRNMDVALNRSFEIAPLIAPVLFVPNTHISMEVNLAYAAFGGAFLTSEVKLAGLNEPADRIYICRRFLSEPPLEQLATLVHELAHYVSGQPVKIIDIVKDGRITKNTAPFDALKPEDKIRSAEHYSFFSIVARPPR